MRHRRTSGQYGFVAACALLAAAALALLLVSPALASAATLHVTDSR
jgi:hypothetical protein